MKVLSIAKKEIVSFFRDKSTIFLLIIPILIFPIYSAGINCLCENDTDVIKICYSSDSEIADTIFRDFVQSDIGFKVETVASDKETELLEENKVDCILAIRNTDIDFICNSKSYNSMSKASKIGEKFQSFFYARISGSHMSYRFNLKNEQDQELNPSDSITNATVPIVLVILCFQNILGFVNDIFSGEKERNTLEMLYLSSSSKAEIYLGKLFALIFFSTINVLISVIAYIFSNKATRLSGYNIVCLIIILLALSVISVTVSSTVSLRAKSIKSSQTVNEFLLAIPMVSTAMLSLGFIRKSSIIHFFPLINLECTLSDILMGDFNPSVFLCDLPVNLLFVFVLSVMNMKYMRSEKIFR